jgi:hypothetical protein
MRISEIFGLQKTQYELDFVDINAGGDTPLFIHLLRDLGLPERLRYEYGTDYIERPLTTATKTFFDDYTKLYLDLQERRRVLRSFHPQDLVRGASGE